ncbi:MAG: hypothetical protein HAW58_05210, partial [Candidatus Thioglobus sp.]|nr:hypothetical protein [Candidatus Thioglobus sp.]
LNLPSLQRQKCSLGGNPANLPTASATSTEVTTAFADIILSGTARTYFLATSVNNGVESTATSAVQTVATAHPLTFRAVAGGTAGTPTGTVWMDRNLGAGQVATASDDAMAYGNYYQWGRAADGHQVQTPTTTATLASSVTPNHADFITVTTGDWLASSVNDNRTIRSAFWSRTDGSSICPTGFRVPTIDELEAEIPSWSSENVAGAFASNLKWTAASFRNLSTGLLANDSTGIYWSSTPHANISESQVLFFGTHARDGLVARANGASVRCIQN